MSRRSRPFLAAAAFPLGILLGTWAPAVSLGDPPSRHPEGYGVSRDAKVLLPAPVREESGPIARAEQMRQLGTQAGVDDAALAARLELGLEDPDPLVRGCAVHGLLHLHPDDVGAMLLARPGAESAERAVLTSLVARRAEDPLLQMHLVEQSCAAARGTADPGTRAHAAGSCAIGSLAAAEEFSRDPSWIVRARVVEALFSGDGPLTADQREALIGRFGDDPHPTVRRLVRAARGEGRQVRPGDLDPDRMAR